MTPEDLSAIESRANAATPRPWKRGRPDQPCADIIGDYIVAPNRDIVGEGTSAVDTDFICAARTDVVALLAEVKRLQIVQTEFAQLSESFIALQNQLTRIDAAFRANGGVLADEIPDLYDELKAALRGDK